jgi:hypothetical protein
MTPPAAPASGFMQIPNNQTITLTVQGTLTQIERLYRSLGSFERVVTVSNLVLEPVEGTNQLRAQVPFKFYLLVEAPKGAAAPAAGSGPPGMGPEGMGGPGMGEQNPYGPPDEPGDGGADATVEDIPAE